MVSNDVPISQLLCRPAFEALTPTEKRYAHFLSRASFQGGLIVLLQTSEESVPIFLLLQKLFGSQSVQSLQDSKPENMSDEDFKVSVLVSVCLPACLVCV